MAIQTTSYPATFSVATPESLSRWLWLVKWLLLIPHFIVLWVLGVVAWFTLLGSWFAIVITGKRPKGLWDFNLGVLQWSERVNAYGSHLTDAYPAFTMDNDPAYPIQLHVEYVEQANRLTTFFRYILSIPHFIVLWFISIVAFFAWFPFILVVILTGKPHQGLFNFLVGVNRWGARVNAYYYLLTDEYPPFSMD